MVPERNHISDAYGRPSKKFPEERKQNQSYQLKEQHMQKNKTGRREHNLFEDTKELGIAECLDLR